MEVAIYSDALNGELAGLGHYTYNLINSLIEIDGTNKYHLINYKKTGLFSDIDEIIIRDPFQRISKAFVWHLYSAIKLRQIENIDLVHNPSHASVFIRFKQKYICTVHDLTPLLFPEHHVLGRPLIFRMMFLTTLKNADGIIADSESTRKDILKYINIPQGKITVIYPGVDYERYKPLSKKEVQVINEKYAFEFPYILYIGTLEPRKNIPFLIEAFHAIKKTGIKHKLVIVGRKGWKYKEIFEIVERLGLQKDIIFTGYVPAEDLPKFYNAADLFVYPSLYEGFGLPPLEAMACGTPVITSNTSSLPEVVGDAGIMVGPYDVSKLADAMLKVLKDEGLRQDMIGRGLERAKLFSWEKTARETLRVYEKVSI